ncbi:hypothetical protein MRB53_026367 [Persea americana]|uniref:Uncharacterized protein n=1 Tax=Persea americana TaxID=3435 RepID=A0ACC2LHX8_PERAE|nr:hypothetical protein MRB53_026367 [Persea americana]
MHKNGVPPSAFTFSSVLSACGRLPAIQEDRDVVSWTAMVAGFAKAGLMKDARRVFDEMPERNVVSWTAMVAGYANSGEVSAAREIFDEMPEKNAVSWTAMIAGYGKCGDVRGARQVFDEICVPDPTSRAAMIACYAQNGFSNEAIEMYWEMRSLNVKANEVAMVGVISACMQLGDPVIANSIAKHMEGRPSELTLVSANALISMYAKCSSIDHALRLFDNMPEKDIISYTALITGLADHGRAQEALEFFDEMQKAGIMPNQITFVGVLNACSYVGMVDEGYAYFEQMTHTFGIIPLTEHYACMVDLLGRAGRLKEAHGLIESMPGAPDAGVWGALLGACKVHCNAELGEIAARHLFEIEPDNTGNYVLLSNIYASLNRWDEAERVRKMMRERGMSKSPGCSWISR